MPDDLSYVTGSIGLLGTEPSWDMMMDCDTLFMVGSFIYTSSIIKSKCVPTKFISFGYNLFSKNFYARIED
ncbi:MAG: hypothetical protein ABJB05_02580 [Parafilimonas sp.]